jgi:hypothetical protein
MKIETIKYAVDSWKRLGVQMITDGDYKGWYIVFKRQNVSGFFEKYINIADKYVIDEQTRIRDYPYAIIECKVTAETFLKGIVSSDSDYVLKTIHEFSNFDDMFIFFETKKYSATDFVWLPDLQYIE